MTTKLSRTTNPKGNINIELVINYPTQLRAHKFKTSSKHLLPSIFNSDIDINNIWKCQSCHDTNSYLNPYYNINKYENNYLNEDTQNSKYSNIMNNDKASEEYLDLSFNVSKSTSFIDESILSNDIAYIQKIDRESDYVLNESYIYDIDLKIAIADIEEVRKHIELIEDKELVQYVYDKDSDKPISSSNNTFDNINEVVILNTYENKHYNVAENMIINSLKDASTLLKPNELAEDPIVTTDIELFEKDVDLMSIYNNNIVIVDITTNITGNNILLKDQTRNEVVKENTKYLDMNTSDATLNSSMRDVNNESNERNNIDVDHNSIYYYNEHLISTTTNDDICNNDEVIDNFHIYSNGNMNVFQVIVNGEQMNELLLVNTEKEEEHLLDNMDDLDINTISGIETTLVRSEVDAIIADIKARDNETVYNNVSFDIFEEEESQIKHDNIDSNSEILKETPILDDNINEDVKQLSLDNTIYDTLPTIIKVEDQLQTDVAYISTTTITMKAINEDKLLTVVYNNPKSDTITINTADVVVQVLDIIDNNNKIEKNEEFNCYDDDTVMKHDTATIVRTEINEKALIDIVHTHSDTAPIVMEALVDEVAVSDTISITSDIIMEALVDEVAVSDTISITSDIIIDEVSLELKDYTIISSISSDTTTTISNEEVMEMRSITDCIETISIDIDIPAQDTISSVKDNGEEAVEILTDNTLDVTNPISITTEIERNVLNMISNDLRYIATEEVDSTYIDTISIISDIDKIIDTDNIIIKKAYIDNVELITASTDTEVVEKTFNITDNTILVTNTSSEKSKPLLVDVGHINVVETVDCNPSSSSIAIEVEHQLLTDDVDDDIFNTSDTCMNTEERKDVLIDNTACADTTTRLDSEVVEDNIYVPDSIAMEVQALNIINDAHIDTINTLSINNEVEVVEAYVADADIDTKTYIVIEDVNDILTAIAFNNTTSVDIVTESKQSSDNSNDVKSLDSIFINKEDVDKLVIQRDDLMILLDNSIINNEIKEKVITNNADIDIIPITIEEEVIFDISNKTFIETFTYTDTNDVDSKTNLLTTDVEDHINAIAMNNEAIEQGFHSIIEHTSSVAAEFVKILDDDTDYTSTEEVDYKLLISIIDDISISTTKVIETNVAEKEISEIAHIGITSIDIEEEEVLDITVTDSEDIILTLTDTILIEHELVNNEWEKEFEPMDTTCIDINGEHSLGNATLSIPFYNSNHTNNNSTTTTTNHNNGNYNSNNRTNNHKNNSTDEFNMSLMSYPSLDQATVPLISLKDSSIHSYDEQTINKPQSLDDKDIKIPKFLDDKDIKTHISLIKPIYNHVMNKPTSHQKIYDPTLYRDAWIGQTKNNVYNHQELTSSYYANSSSIDNTYYAFSYLVIGIVVAYLIVFVYRFFKKWYNLRIPQYLSELEKQVIDLLNKKEFLAVKNILEREIPVVQAYKGSQHVDTAAFKHFLAKALLGLSDNNDCSSSKVYELIIAESYLNDVIDIYHHYGEDIYMAHVLEDLALVQQQQYNQSLMKAIAYNTHQHNSNRNINTNSNDSINPQLMIMKALKNMKRSLRIFKEEAILLLKSKASYQNNNNNNFNNTSTIYKDNLVNKDLNHSRSINNNQNTPYKDSNSINLNDNSINNIDNCDVSFDGLESLSPNDISLLSSSSSLNSPIHHQRMVSTMNYTNTTTNDKDNNNTNITTNKDINDKNNINTSITNNNTNNIKNKDYVQLDEDIELKSYIFYTNELEIFNECSDELYDQDEFSNQEFINNTLDSYSENCYSNNGVVVVPQSQQQLVKKDHKNTATTNSNTVNNVINNDIKMMLATTQGICESPIVVVRSNHSNTTDDPTQCYSNEYPISTIYDENDSIIYNLDKSLELNTHCNNSKHLNRCIKDNEDPYLIEAPDTSIQQSLSIIFEQCATENLAEHSKALEELERMLLEPTKQDMSYLCTTSLLHNTTMNLDYLCGDSSLLYKGNSLIEHVNTSFAMHATFFSEYGVNNCGSSFSFLNAIPNLLLDYPIDIHVARLHIRVALILTILKQYHESLINYQIALYLNQEIYGKNSKQVEELLNDIIILQQSIESYKGLDDNYTINTNDTFDYSIDFRMNKNKIVATTTTATNISSKTNEKLIESPNTVTCNSF